MKRGEIVGKQKFNNIKKVIRKTYSELEAEYLRQLEIKGRNEYTIRSCKYHSKHFLEFLEEDIECSEITEQTIEDYISYMKATKQITNGVTINSYIRNITIECMVYTLATYWVQRKLIAH